MTAGCSLSSLDNVVSKLFRSFKMIAKKRLALLSFAITIIVCLLRLLMLKENVKNTVHQNLQLTFSKTFPSRNPPTLMVVKQSYFLPRVVVSLASFSRRLSYIDATLQSIFEQTYQPDQIYLNVPLGNYSRYKLPPISLLTIAQIQGNYKGTNLRVIKSEDYGPATKLLGILRQEIAPDTIIVTVDDDTIYHPQMLAYLVTTLSNLPKNSSVAVVCETVSKHQQEWRWVVTDVKNDYCKNGYLAAYAGAAYRREYFDETIFNYEHVPDGCILHDDVYISGYLTRKSIVPYIIAPIERTDDFPWSVIQHQVKTNLTVHGSPNLREKQLDCIKYFNYFH